LNNASARLWTHVGWDVGGTVRVVWGRHEECILVEAFRVDEHVRMHIEYIHYINM
jgi:hypothetical protein